jgi:hypothetical protein
MIDVAMKFEGAEITIMTGDSFGLDKILVLSAQKNIARDIDAALQSTRRLTKVNRGCGEIWGVGVCDGFEIVVPGIGKCDRIEETIEEPEYAPTGRTIKTTRMRYVCAEGG